MGIWAASKTVEKKGFILFRMMTNFEYFCIQLTGIKVCAQGQEGFLWLFLETCLMRISEESKETNIVRKKGKI